MIQFFNTLSNQTIDVFVFWWQSNMNGEADTSILIGDYAKYSGALSECQILGGLTSGDFQGLEAGVNSRTNTPTQSYQDFGPDVSCMKDLSDHFNRTVYGIKYAIGGTGVGDITGNDWNPSSGELYQTLFYKSDNSSFCTRGINLLQADFPNKKIKIRAVFGCGGEEDAEQENVNFVTDLQSVISQARIDLNEPRLKFFFNKLQINCVAGTSQAVSDIRAGFETVAAADNFVYLIDVDDLNLKADNIHLDYADVVILGQRFTQAYLDSL